MSRILNLVRAAPLLLLGMASAHGQASDTLKACLLYTSDAADE